MNFHLFTFLTTPWFYIGGFVLSLSIVVFYYLYIILRWGKSLKYIPKFPYPVIGHANYFIGCDGDSVNILFKVLKTYPQHPIAVLLGHSLFWLITTPEDMESVTSNPNAIQKSSVYRFLSADAGIFANRNVQQWKRNRKFIISTFNQKTLNRYIEAFNDLSEVFCARLTKYVGKGEFDVFPEAYNLTTDIIAKTIFDLDTKLDDSMFHMAERIDKINRINYNRIHKPWEYPDWIFNMLPSTKIYRQLINDVDMQVYDIVKSQKEKYHQRKINYEYNDEKRMKPTVGLLIELAEEQKAFTDWQIMQELCTLFVGGSDSSAITSSFSLMLLGMHQDIQDRVYEEIKEIFGDSKRPITAEDLSQMKLLERVIKETLRLFPIGPVIARQALADIPMKNYIIPKGSEIVLNIMHIHRNEKYWDNPLVFDPDRFLPENFSKIHPYAYIPFSAGARNCPGIQFAMMSLKTVVASALRCYKVHSKKVPLDSLNLKTELMLRTKDGNIISIERR